MATNVRNLRIEELLKSAEEGKLILPNFQRPFRWKVNNIVRLAESLFKQIPIGTSLLYRTQLKEYSFRYIDEINFGENPNGNESSNTDSNEDDEDEETLAQDENNSSRHQESDNNRVQDYQYILDGQQRITSLHKIFRKDLIPTEEESKNSIAGRRFFLNLRHYKYPIPGINENDDLIISIKLQDLKKSINNITNNNEDVTEKMLMRYCAVSGLYPITRDIVTGSTTIRDKFNQALSSRLLETRSTGSDQIEQLMEIQNEVSEWYTDNLASIINYINTFTFTALEISNVSLDALTAIFETINSTGMQLTVFDLLVSKLGTFELNDEVTNLPEIMRKNIDNFYLSEFDDGVNRLGGNLSQQMPKAFALYTQKNNETGLNTISLKKSDVLDNKYKSYFQTESLNVTKAINLSADFHYHRLFVFKKKYIPLKDTISLLSPFILENKNNASIQNKITAFYWYFVFFIRYDQSTDLILQKQFDEFIKAYQNNDYSSFIDKLDEFPPFDFVLTAPGRSSLSKAILTYVHSNSVKDWAGEDLKIADIEYEDHHIFPKDWLRNNCGR